jgi:hypothetical protein
MSCLKEVQRSRTLVTLLRLGLHVSNFMNHGTGRITRAIQMKTVSKFVNVRGTPQGVTESSGKNIQVPPYACKTLMHFLAFVADDGLKTETPQGEAADSSSPAPKNSADYGFAANTLLNELTLLDEVCGIDLSAVEIALKDLEKGLALLRKELGLWQLSMGGDRRGDGVAGSSNVAHPGVAQLKYFAHTFGEEVSKVQDVYNGAFSLGKRVMTVLGEAPPSKKDDSSDKDITVAELTEFLKVIAEIKRGFSMASKDNTNAQNALRRAKEKAAAAHKAKEAAEAKKASVKLSPENEDVEGTKDGLSRKGGRNHPPHGRSRGGGKDTTGGRIRSSSSANWDVQRRNDRGNTGGLLGALSRMRLDISGGAQNGDSSSDDDWNSDDD